MKASFKKNSALALAFQAVLSASTSHAESSSPFDGHLRPPSLDALQSITDPTMAALSDSECLVSDDIMCKSLWVYEFAKHEHPAQRAFLLTELTRRLVQSGNRDPALSLLDDLRADAKARSETDDMAAYDLASFGRLYLELGDEQKAYTSFQDAVRTNEGIIGSIYEDFKDYAEQVAKEQGVETVFALVDTVDQRFRSAVLQVAIDQLILDRSYDKAKEAIYSLPAGYQRAVNIATIQAASGQRNLDERVDLSTVFNEITDPIAKLRAHIGVAKKMLKLGEDKTAQDLVGLIVYQNMTLDARSNMLDENWCEIFRLEVKRIGFSAASRWLKEISDEEYRDSCRFYAISDLINAGIGDGLEELATSIDSGNGNLQAQSMEMVVEFLAGKDIARARALLHDWERQYSFDQQEFFYGPAVTDVAAALVRNGEADQAVDMIHALPTRQLGLATSAVTAALVRAGQQNHAVELYREIRQNGWKARAFLNSM